MYGETFYGRYTAQHQLGRILTDMQSKNLYGLEAYDLRQLRLLSETITRIN